jgi:hypothetical protein
MNDKLVYLITAVSAVNFPLAWFMMFKWCDFIAQLSRLFGLRFMTNFSGKIDRQSKAKAIDKAAINYE